MELPHEDDIRWIVSRYAHLRAAHGEVIGEPDLVEPTGEYFPDTFAPSPEGVAAMAKRMLTYAPVSTELGLELAFHEGESGGGGSCGTGGCGTGGGGGLVGEAIARGDGGYRIVVAVRDVGDPVLLATSLARSAGGVMLGEAGEEVGDGERLAMAELAGTVCGLGLLFSMGSCVYTKGCGGLRAHQGTQLDVASSALALALFVRVHEAKAGTVRRHLETTQREAFDECLRWVDSRPKLVAALRSHPESLIDGVFPVEDSKGIFSRLFGAKNVADEPEAIVVKRRKRSPEEERKLAETRALVEAALRHE
jgi:hypothetical protein